MLEGGPIEKPQAVRQGDPQTCHPCPIKQPPLPWPSTPGSHSPISPSLFRSNSMYFSGNHRGKTGISRAPVTPLGGNWLGLQGANTSLLTPRGGFDASPVISAVVSGERAHPRCTF